MVGMRRNIHRRAVHVHRTLALKACDAQLTDDDFTIAMAHVA